MTTCSTTKESIMEWIRVAGQLIWIGKGEIPRLVVALVCLLPLMAWSALRERLNGSQA